MTANGPLRVLVAEDDPLECDIMMQLLERAGLRVVQPPATGLAGLFKRLEDEHVDVLVLDLTLEDANEETTVVAIKEMAQHSAVVVVSGTADATISFDARENGASAFIPKSISLAGVLERTVREAWSTWNEQRRRKGMASVAAKPFDETPERGTIIPLSRARPPKEGTSAGIKTVLGNDGEELTRITVPKWLLKKVAPPLATAMTAALVGWFGHAAQHPEETPAPAPEVQKIDQRITTLESVAQTFREHISNEMVFETIVKADTKRTSEDIADIKSDLHALLQQRLKENK